MRRLLVVLVSAAFAVTGLTTPAHAATGDVFNSVNVTPTTFYPRVQDGYRDDTNVTWETNGHADVSIDVLNSSGTSVRHDDVSSDYSGSWAWDGTTNGGANAWTGYYTLELVGTDPDTGATETVDRRVRLLTGYQTSTVSKRKTGYATTSTSHSSSCYVDRDAYDETTGLDCWWGRYAQANYGFSLPSNAYNVTWGVAGYPGCCSSGSISKWGNRASSTYYRVHVKVTGSREYIVERVRATYTYRHRI